MPFSLPKITNPLYDDCKFLSSKNDNDSCTHAIKIWFKPLIVQLYLICYHHAFSSTIILNQQKT